MAMQDASAMFETAPQTAAQYRVRRRPLDTVTLEIIRGKLLALADEMGIVLARTAMSPVIYEVLDFACGFCDPEGQLISQTNGITVFTGTFASHVDVVRRKYADQIRPGDIYMSNNPYEGGDIAGLSRRARLDAGTLGVVAVTANSAGSGCWAPGA